jgi:hypothetical protein
VEEDTMGYPVKVQKVERPTGRSFYVNLPVAVADALDIKKAETFEWAVEDRNTLTFTRSQKARSTARKKASRKRSR